jgi:RNA polymerase sigma-70 factor, ECF subfamily
MNGVGKRGRGAAGLRRQDDEEFTAMVERHSRFVFRVAYSLLRNAHDAEDAVQEMFLNLYRKQAWRDVRDERAFLARVTWRTAMDKLRQRRPASESGIDPIDPEDLIAASPDPEQSAIDASSSLAIHVLIDSLPEELRQPLALSSIEEMNSREIAAVMSIPEGTVRTRLLRARQMLRQKITAIEEGRHARVRY